jgi:hypothetical protein
MIGHATAARSTEQTRAAKPRLSNAPAVAPFLYAFEDSRFYFPAPGGDFETDTRGWTLTRGATASPGSGSLRLGAAANSLRLPAGATVTSPTFCVDLIYPTFRFFSSKGRGPLGVDVIYPALGTKKLKATTVKGGASGWTLVKDVDLRPATVTKDAG